MSRKVYLVITPFFPEPGNFRGPYVLDQVKAIMRCSDYHVVVMKPIPFWKKAEDYEIDGVKVYRFHDYSLPGNIWPNSYCDKLSAISMFTKLKEIGINVEDIAVCHGHVTALGAYSLAVKKKNPNCIAIVQHHGFDVMSVTNGRFAKYKWHEKLCIRYGTHICNAVDLNIGVSQKTLDYVKSYPNVHLKREYVLYNGVDTGKFYPEKQQKKDDKFVIGCIGNFWPLKDQMTLIKAVEQLIRQGINDICVRFIGTGETRQECEQYVQEHDLQIYFSFENEVMHDELRSFYNSLDLFVLPSYWEAFGCVYTEAYACGIPFIGVEGQGIAEIIPEKDKSQWLIKKGDYHALIKIISNYRKKKTEQRLSHPWKIDELMELYLNELKGLGLK